MPMMNSEARKRAEGQRTRPATVSDPLAGATQLADQWDREADREDACGNGIAAVILHAHAEELRAAIARAPLSA
ncbi:hypothetical protein [Nocardioides sp. SYSU DS0651]|uniref:hypothetical protein n=1 Tax=Nocardioides sp. SYSU DS0651 TaxID=3415955 RepID=UPI003F4C75B2